MGHGAGSVVGIVYSTARLMATPRQIIGVVQDITTQKQSQTAMRLAQLALDYAGDSILWTDSNGSLIYVNHATCASLGYTADELLTMRLSDVVRTISPEYWTEIWELLRQQRSLTFEAQHWRKDGSTFPVEVSVSYITFDGNEYAYGFARDITERKQQERDLRTFKPWSRMLQMGLRVRYTGDDPIR